MDNLPKNFNRRNFLRSTALLGGGLALGLPSFAPTASAKNKSLILYNGQHAQTTNALVEAFTQATGIKVQVRSGNSIQLANQIIEEGRRSPADVFYSEESPPVAALSERNLLAPLQEDTLENIRPIYKAKDGTWTGITARCRVTVYNPNLVSKEELPESVMDMATAKWQGKLAFVPTSGAFQQQIVAINHLKGREAALNWLKGLKQYGRIYNSNMAAMRAVERGEIGAALVNNYYWYIVAREKGAENMQSQMHYSGAQDPGALITVSAAGVLKTAKNATAAQQLVNFMTSLEGQQVLAARVAEWPMNPKVKSTFDIPPFEQLNPPEVNPANLGGADEALELRREAGLA